MGWFNKKEKQIIEYRILIDQYLDHLEGKVNAHIKNGWQPIGGVSSSLNHNYVQAMVKYK
jgi:hypothetical protein